MSGFLAFPRDAVAVVTGAASGIGRSVADLLGRNGVAVAGWDIASEAIAEWETAGTVDAHRLGVAVDLDDPDAVAAAIELTTSTLGPVGFLVNNAGPASTTALPYVVGLDRSIGVVERVTSAWLGWPGSSGGHVVNIASVAGTSVGGLGTEAWYPSGKAAILGYTRHLAVTRPNGIRANAVAPGIIETPRTRVALASGPMQEIVARNPMRRVGAPGDVAAAVVFLLAPVSGYINGVLLPVDGGSLLTL